MDKEKNPVKSQSDHETKRIVILGAGFGGLTAAMKLGKFVSNNPSAKCEIVLVDKNDYHTYTPTLYEASTTPKEVADLAELKSIVTFPIRELLGDIPVRFIKDEIESLDISSSGGSINLKSGEKLHYDYLLIALGSKTNYFNIPGLKESALELKTFTDAMRVREAVWAAVQESERTQNINIIVGGAGSTGVELAGELRSWLNELGELRRNRIKVSIVEANPSVLFSFDPQVINKVTRRLRKIGVNLELNTKIKSVDRDKKTIATEDGREIPFDVFIWSGGVMGNPILSTIPLKAVKGRAEVTELMNCLPQTPDLQFAGMVYAIGDIVCVMNSKTGKPVPMVARAAITQAKVAAHNIICDLMGKSHIKYVMPAEYPYVIPVGGKFAVSKIGPIIISGLFGWIFKGLIELYYLSSIMPVHRAIKTWLKGLKIFIQNDRLG